MAINNNINNETQQLTIDPGASGDSFVQFNINATGEFRIGIDDSASDAFVMSQGSALGTNNTFSMSAAGELRRALQPAFSAQNSSTATDVTGDGTVYTIVASSERFDQNSDWSSSTFTAPVSGRYYFSAKIWIRNAVSAASTSGNIAIVTSNRAYTSYINNPAVLQQSTDFTPSFSIFSDMDASDTTTVTVTLSGGTKTVDIFGAIEGTAYTIITGNLVC